MRIMAIIKNKYDREMGINYIQNQNNNNNQMDVNQNQMYNANQSNQGNK